MKLLWQRYKAVGEQVVVISARVPNCQGFLHLSGDILAASIQLTAEGQSAETLSVSMEWLSFIHKTPEYGMLGRVYMDFAV